MPFEPHYLATATLKRRLGIASTVVTHDADLAGVLAGVEAAIQTELGYDPAHGSATEFYDGGGSEVIVLNRWPVVSITNVWEDESGYFGEAPDSFDATESLLVEGEDYVLDTGGGGTAGRLLRLAGVWPFARRRGVGSLADAIVPSRGSIKVTYLAGRGAGVTVSADVVEAAYHEAAVRWTVRGGAAGPKTNESLNGYSYSVADWGGKMLGERSGGPFLSPLLKTALAPYRNIPIGRR